MAGGNNYDLHLDNATILADATLLFIRAATAISSRGSLLQVNRIEFTQHGTATSQQLGVIIAQKATAYGTYVSATPSPHNIGGVASAIAGGTTGAAATAGVNASAEGAGTVSNLWTPGFNNLAGYLWVPTPEERIIIQPDMALIVKLRGTPTNLTGWDALLNFTELN